MKRPSKKYNKAPLTDDRRSWRLDYEGFEPSEEGLRESLLTLCNGYFGTRGAANEARASKISYPGTYLAGVYNKLATNISGRKVYNEDLVNCPNWLPVSFRLSGGKWISFDETEVLSDKRSLDLIGGVLYRETLFSDSKGRKVKVCSERIVHMAYPHIGAVKYVIEPVDYEGELCIRTALDGTVENTGVARYRGLRSKHLKPLNEGISRDGHSWLYVKTSQSGIRLAVASKEALYINGRKSEAGVRIFKKKKQFVYRDIKLKTGKGDEYRIDKVVAIHTSNDLPKSDPLKSALSSVREAPWFDALKRSHEKKWRDIWQECGFRVVSSGDTSKIINFHTFHLLQTATRHNSEIDAALPARGLHGEAYRGHIFWDEMFVMPLYDYQAPHVSRALLKYRFARLREARKYARDNGYKGAMFPWQSGSTGEEETQELHLNPMSGKWGPDYSRNQRHISFSIAYNIWKFWERTGDKKFMDLYGSELFLSIACFCSCLAEYSEKDGRYHTHGLMGPDEFHEKMPFSEDVGYTDNAYSNIFIVWILSKAMILLDSLPPEKRRSIMKRSGISPDSIERWEHVVRKMNLDIRGDGVISQFDGYFGLKELNWDHYRKKYGDIHRMDRILKSEGKTPNAYKVAKQADVLMMFYVFSLREIRDIFEGLGYRFSSDILKRNYDHYIERTSHGSTLSRVVHCYIAHVMGRKKEAWRWYRDVLASDIHDVQGGTTPEGIHVGVMGGSIDIIIRAFAGIGAYGGMLSFEPKLPEKIEKIEFTIFYRRHKLSVFIDKDRIILELIGKRKGTGSLPVMVRGKKKVLSAGRKCNITLSPAEEERAMARKKILIVNGDVTSGEELSDRLLKEDFQTRFVSTGKDADGILKEEWVDLIILSIKLQGDTDGFQLLKMIKGDKELSRIPVIIDSDKPAMKPIFRKIGVAGFFTEPYSVSALIKKVNKIFGV